MQPPAGLLAVGLLLTAIAAPATAFLEPVEDAAGVDSCQVESLDRDYVVPCVVDGIEGDVEDAGQNAGTLPDPTASDWCGKPTERKRFYGASEEKWTPLYGVNSPKQGFGAAEIQEGQTVGMTIGFTFEGSGVRLNDAESTTITTTFKAENGHSMVLYQKVEWTEYTRKRCGWDFEWHTIGHGYKITDYYPHGGPLPLQKMGDLMGPSAESDHDNYLRPQGADWSTPENTIALNLRFQTIDGDQCLKNADKYFGSEAVYNRDAELNFAGVVIAGSTRSETEANSFHYHFDDGCYVMDALGGSGGGIGLAFQMYDATADTGESGECSGKDLLVAETASCVEQACGDEVPSVHEAQELLCAAMPGCGELEVEVPVLCTRPQECGEGGVPGEACSLGLPGKPSCPPPSVALPVESCEPCEALKTPLVECSIPHPSCEEAGLDCPPVGRPGCGDYAEGMEGQIARWVCEGGPDPCVVAVLEAIDDLLACGIGPED